MILHNISKNEKNGPKPIMPVMPILRFFRPGHPRCESYKKNRNFIFDHFGLGILLLKIASLYTLLLIQRLDGMVLNRVLQFITWILTNNFIILKIRSSGMLDLLPMWYYRTSKKRNWHIHIRSVYLIQARFTRFFGLKFCNKTNP